MRHLIEENKKSEYKINEDIIYPYKYPVIHVSVYENTFHLGQENGDNEDWENDVVSLSVKQAKELWQILDKEIRFFVGDISISKKEIPDFNEQHMPGTKCW
jgi:hypothetical protein